jgi:alpha-L-rhamnosidase
MKPMPVGDLKFVKATHRSPYGLISSEWHKDGDKFDWQIEVPPNTTAMVYIPNKNSETLDKIISNLDGVHSKPIMADGGSYATFTVGSGNYRFKNY